MISTSQLYKSYEWAKRNSTEMWQNIMQKRMGMAGALGSSNKFAALTAGFIGGGTPINTSKVASEFVNTGLVKTGSTELALLEKASNTGLLKKGAFIAASAAAVAIGAAILSKVHEDRQRYTNRMR